MGENIALIRLDEAQALTRLPETTEGSGRNLFERLRGSRPFDN